MLPPGMTKTCSKTEDEIRAEAAERTRRDVEAVRAALCVCPSADRVFEIAMRHYGHHFHLIEEAATTYHTENPLEYGEATSASRRHRGLSYVPGRDDDQHD